MSIFQKPSSLDDYIVQNSTDNNIQNKFFLKQLKTIINRLQKSETLTPVILNGIVTELKLLKNVFIKSGHSLAIYELELGIKMLVKDIKKYNITDKHSRKQLHKIIEYFNITYFKIQQEQLLHIESIKSDKKDHLLGTEYILQRLDNIATILEEDSDIELSTFNTFSNEFGIMKKICQSIEEAQSDHRSLVGVIYKFTILQDTFSYSKKIKKTINDIEKAYLALEIRNLKKHMENLIKHDIVPNEITEKRWIEYANKDLVSRIYTEDFFSLSLKNIVETFLNIWNKIILEILDINFRMNKDIEWYVHAYNLMNKILIIFTKNERLLYVGIGFVIASFFAYFLSLSS